MLPHESQNRPYIHVTYVNIIKFMLLGHIKQYKQSNFRNVTTRSIIDLQYFTKKEVTNTFLCRHQFCSFAQISV